MTTKMLSEIFIYPVKSLGGISVPEAEITDRGLKYDRRWMLVDENNNFISQRKYPQMALINCELRITSEISNAGNLEFRHKEIGNTYSIGINETTEETLDAIVWNDRVKVLRVNPLANEWFGNTLGIKCSLVYMPDESIRRVDNKYANNNEVTSLSDGFPFLIIGQASLDDLNSRLEKKLPMNRFRPNFVFTGGSPFEEDEMKSFLMSEIKFFGVKQCGRCVVTTVNQDTAEKGEEPLRTLSSYRTINNKVMFGMNLLHEGSGVVRIGDKIKVIELR